jgi:hypothetical protein
MADVNSGFLDTAYGDTPWEDIETNQRTVYVPELLEQFRQKSLFYGLVTFGVNLRAQRTGTMVFTQVLDPEPNIAELATRQIWLPQLYMDSRQLEITAAYYGDKIMMHKHEDDITYWKENGVAGLRRIVSSRLAPHTVASLDLLARNAFLDKAVVMFAGGASDFESLQADDTYEVGIARAVHLGADYQPDPVQNPIIAVTSPSAIYSVRDTTAGEFISRRLYTDNRLTVNYEVGEYEGVRMAQHPSVTLWNCGEVLVQTTIAATITLGDGAPDPATTKVNKVWKVGQPDATHYITVADSTGFEAGDIVTLHVHRQGDASTYDTACDTRLRSTLGVIYNDPKMIVREIYSVATGKLVFTEPISVDYFQTDLGSTVFGYVTKGRPVHASVYLKGPRGVVAGVVQPPQTYNPAPIDDTEAIYRFSWDARMKYQQMYPNRFEVYFHAGPIRKLGAVVNL